MFGFDTGSLCLMILCCHHPPPTTPPERGTNIQDIPTTTSIYLQISPAGAGPQGVNHGL